MSKTETSDNASTKTGYVDDSNRNSFVIDMETDDEKSKEFETEVQKGETEIENVEKVGDRQIDITNLAQVYECLEGWPRRANHNVIWVQFFGMEENQAQPTGAPLNYEPSSRNGFIRLVFFLVLVMLLCTAGFVYCVLKIDTLNDFFRRYGLFMMIPAVIIVILVSIAMSCSACTRVPPCNFFLLAITVCCMSVVAGYVTRRYQTQTVLLAVLATTIVVFVCFLLACSNFDFTKFLLYIVLISAAFGAIAMVVVVSMLITKTYLQPLHLALLIVGTIIQVIVLTMELQLILGGKTVELGEDDYALGAFMLYSSIIDIFLKMVSMIGMTE